MSRSLTRFCAAGALACALCASAEARAELDADEARGAAAREIESVRAAAGALAAQVVQKQAARSAEKLIALGELSLRSGDHEQAVDTLNQALELFRQGKASLNAHAEGLFLLAQAYFESGQLLSARREYSELLALGRHAPYSAYAGRSLARLVDVAVQTNQRPGLDALAVAAERLPADPTGSLDYARGKLSLARRRLPEAKASVARVAATSAWYHQAQYVLGAALLEEALAGAGLGGLEDRSRLVITRADTLLAPAIEQFRAVARLPGDSPEHRQVIDAARLAVGRLCYEAEDYLEAARAFIQVGQSSPAFHDMLFELAWVYVRVGDYERAERALELLDVAAPDTLDVADGALLRADLMLRSGRFERALQAYEEVRTRFMPARQSVTRFLASSSDPAVHYDRLVEEGLSLGGATALPEVVLEWAREEARDERAFALIDEVGRARDVLRRSRQLASKLTALLVAPSRTQAFPELKAAMEKTLGLANQLSQARRLIALGVDDVQSEPASGALGEAQRARRALMAKPLAAPVTPADFRLREERGNERWNRLSQALQRATLETDKLQAVINGLRRVLDADAEQGLRADPARRARFQSDVEAHERELAMYRAHIETYRQEIDNGRVQVGLGDVRYVEDERARRSFRELLGRELELLAAGHGDEDARDYARSVAPLLADMMALDHWLEGVMQGLDAEVSRGSDELGRLVAEERSRIEVYSDQLDALERDARLLVGQVAMDNFASVRERLRGIVLRADVGIVQQAWELREEQQGRLRGLQRQRAVEEQNLESELREVVDDMSEQR